jgi:flagellin
MTRINTNVATLRGLRSMNKANNMLNQSLTRLSSGLKINSGKDSPAGLIASETLGSQISSIQQSISNSNRANNVISTADSALGEIGGLLTQVRGLVQEGLNKGALSDDEIKANQLQIDSALSAINKIAANTNFAGSKLIDGSKAFTTNLSTLDAGKLSDFQVNQAVFGSSGTISLDATVTQQAQKAQLQYNGGALSGAATVEVSGSKGQEVVFLGSSSTLSNVKDAINGTTDSTGVSARIVSGMSVKQDAAANTLTTAVAGNNNDLVFTDARATNDLGSNSSLGGAVNVLYKVAGNNTALSVDTATASNGDTTITVNLATDGTGAATSLASEVMTAVNQDATASKYVTAANASGNDGTGTVAALGSTALAGGTDAASLTISDARTANSAGNVNIVFAGGASKALGVSVSHSGNDSTITVQLGTDANSAVTSTMKQVADAIAADASAKSLVGVSLAGDGNHLAKTVTSTQLSSATGSLVLESSDYGSNQSVGVNVLSGSFDTYSSTAGSTALTRSNRDSGQDIGVSINGQQAQTSGLSATIRTNSLDATLSFNSSANTVNQSLTLNITGGGSIFQIGQEVSQAGQIGVGIEAVNTARLGGVSGKLYELGSGGGKSLQDINSGNASGADAVAVIQEAINRVSTLRGRLGAVQKNVIDTNVATLGVALENISEARSQIVDTDFAEETANLTKSQVLSQASMSVLGIANQSPSQVLSLLRG